ncbi:F-box protein CPR1-like [Papaver somniferum]|uniref:F-box protein CPR1-like n=1 Tax=Papaver somniferum TaxID=3469 RepID=UPI000E7058FA|nr:F-box protein CPR1-like [Papaver somniferum]
MLKAYYFDDHKVLFRSIDYSSISSALWISSPACTCDWDVPWYYAFGNMNYTFIQMLGSGNDLICMAINRLEDICIWNPSTGEYRITPLPSSDFLTGEPQRNLGHIFNYDCIADDYKLARIAEKRSSYGFSSKVNSGYYQVDIYTLGSKSWRLVGTFPSISHYMFLYEKKLSVIFMNGALHWLGVLKIKGVTFRVIVSLDVRSGGFVEFFYPKKVQELIKNTYGVRECTVGELEECLCLGVYHKLINHIDVWFVQEYGVRESWTKRYSFSTTNVSVDSRWKLLWSFTAGELLMDTGFD